jgi:uncharacterized protein YegL
MVVDTSKSMNTFKIEKIDISKVALSAQLEKYFKNLSQKGLITFDK